MKRLLLLVALAAVIGCRDQYPSEPGPGGRSIMADFFLTDLSRHAIVKMNATGESNVVIPASTGQLWGDDPVLPTPVESGKMVYVTHAYEPSGAAVALAGSDGSTARIVFGERNTRDSLIEHSVALSTDGAWVTWAVASGSGPSDSILMRTRRSDLNIPEGFAFPCAVRGQRLVGAPSFSPDAGRIAWFCTAPASAPGFVLMIADRDGRNLQTLFSIPSGIDDDDSPAWLPDGSSIVVPFVPIAGIAIVRIDGGGNTLKSLNQIGDVHGIAMSPDGATLAFSARDVAGSGIWVMDVESSQVTEISNSDSQRDFNPQWSRDGSKILFLRSIPEYGATGIGVPVIYDRTTGRKYTYAISTVGAFWAR